MPSAFRLLFAFSVFFRLFFFESGAVAEENASGDVPVEPEWFSGAGIDLRAGAFFAEKATGRSFRSGMAIGPDILVEAWRLGMHGIGLGAGFLHLDSAHEKGTRAIRVETSVQRLELAARYRFVWKLLVAEARLGTAVSLVDVEMSTGEPGWYVEGEELVYSDPEQVDELERSGSIWGFLGGLSVGLALGELMWDLPDLLELRAGSDYVRRGERDEITVFGTVVFWPTRFWD
ncbi:MAG: hypothetical protein R6V85_12270 [Polyangia bacterium]